MRHAINPADFLLGASLLPPIKAANELTHTDPILPPELIHGVLHQGSKMIMGGASKGRKTWMLMDLAICVSEGLHWWGFPTTQTPVLYINLEIQEPFAAKRLNSLKASREIQDLPNLKLWNLRGYAAPLEELTPKITEQLTHHNVGLLILDPLYKVLGDTEENANTDMALLLNNLESIAVQHGCAVVFAHHFRKGGPSDGAAMDRMSGAGVLARDPDSIVTMQDHEDEDCVVVDMTLRNFPPINPFGMSWEFPVFNRNDDIDTSKLRGKGGQKAKVSTQQVANLIPFRDGVTKKELVGKIMDDMGVCDRSAYRYVKAALDKGDIKMSPAGGCLVRGD